MGGTFCRDRNAAQRTGPACPDASGHRGAEANIVPETRPSESGASEFIQSDSRNLHRDTYETAAEDLHYNESTP